MRTPARHASNKRRLQGRNPNTGLLCALVLLSLPRSTVPASVCGEHLQCSGMTPMRRSLIRARLVKDKAKFTKESCSSVIYGHALHYTPSENCEDDPGHKEAKQLTKEILNTCFADTLQLVVPARLCLTHAQYKAHEFTVLYVIAALNTALVTGWVHYYD